MSPYLILRKCTEVIGCAMDQLPCAVERLMARRENLKIEIEETAGQLEKLRLANSPATIPAATKTAETPPPKQQAAPIKA